MILNKYALMYSSVVYMCYTILPWLVFGWIYCLLFSCCITNVYPDSKVHGANMGPTWVLSAPDGPHVAPMNLAIRVIRESELFWLLNWDHLVGYFMMAPSNGNIFRVTGHLCGEFTGEFLAQRPVTRSFDALFDLRLNKWLSKQSWGYWFETLSCPLSRHCNVVGW